MGKNSSISWTHHTFNPWWGCVKVSPACANCYAEAISKRFGLSIWGHDAPRRFMSDHYWDGPGRWNRQAAKEGVRHRVFCASMADVFEDRPELDQHRAKLFKLIEETPNLDWLLLTKRPENMISMAPSRWRDAWPSNAWAGATAETQYWLSRRVIDLLKVPSRIHWLSAEPLLECIDLERVEVPSKHRHQGIGPIHMNVLEKHVNNPFYPDNSRIDWVIVGGESGHCARPMEPDWVLSIMAQCRNAGVAFHFKQTGSVMAERMRFGSTKGDDPKEWPTAFRIREVPD